MTLTLRRTRIANEALAFQADLDRLVAEPAPIILRLWPALGAALIVTLVLIANAVRVDIVVTASGRLAVDAPPIILQPISRAVLRSLLVKPGDTVQAGQIVATFDNTFSQADLAALLAERRALMAETARLKSEIDGTLLVAVSADDALQADVQAQRSGLAVAQRLQLQTAQASLDKALQAETSAASGLQDRLAIARQIEAMHQKLADRQSGSRLAALQATLTRIDAEAALNAHDARLQDLQERQIEAIAALTAFDADRRREKAEALAALSPRLAQNDEALTKARRLAALSDLRAPRPGIVLSVAKGGPGSVLSDGEPAVVLVPTDVALIATIELRSADVGTVGVGDEVTLKIDAYPWRQHGTVAGHLQDISRASFTPDGMQGAFHAGRIALGGALTGLPLGGALLPGMTLTAEIKTGRRSVLDYFLDPLMRGLNESLREP